MLKLGGTNFFFKKKRFPASRNHFRFSCQRKQFFLLMETYFSMNALFREVKTDHFSYIFFQRLLPVKAFFSFSRKRIFERILHSCYFRRIFSLVQTICFIGEFFSTSGNPTDMSGNQSLKTELILAGGNWFAG